MSDWRAWTEFSEVVPPAAVSLYMEETRQMLGDLFDGTRTVEQLVELAWSPSMFHRLMRVPGVTWSLARQIQYRMVTFITDAGRASGIE